MGFGCNMMALSTKVEKEVSKFVWRVAYEKNSPITFLDL